MPRPLNIKLVQEPIDFFRKHLAEKHPNDALSVLRQKIDMFRAIKKILVAGATLEDIKRVFADLLVLEADFLGSGSKKKKSSKKKNSAAGPTYKRFGVFSFDEVFPHVILPREKISAEGKRKIYIGQSEGKEVKFQVNMASQRYQLFVTKGVACAFCGLEGRFLALEQIWAVRGISAHFNLYGFDEKGNEVMLTKDHIVPKSLGGQNTLKNYQVLCAVCNFAKADSLNPQNEPNNADSPGEEQND